MEIQRTLILLGIAVVTYLLILNWQDYTDAPVEEPTEEAEATEPEHAPDDMPAVADTDDPDDDGDLPRAEEAPEDTDDPPETPDRPEAEVDDDELLNVSTDVLQVRIDPEGGDIVGVRLPDYPLSIDDPDTPFVLMDRSQALHYVSQSGIVGPNGTDTEEGRPRWETDRTEWHLDDDERRLKVDLHHEQEDGTSIIKRYTFTRGSYNIGVSHIVDNRGEETWRGALYGQIRRDGSEDPGRATAGFIPMPTFLGAAYWTSDRPYNRKSLSNMRDDRLQLVEEGGWIAFLQHYFLSAWVPDEHRRHTYSTLYREQHDEYIMRFVSPITRVEAGEQEELRAQFYAGPKIQDQLREISPGLHMTVDYGWLWFLAQPIFSVLVFLQSGRLQVFGMDVDIGVGVGNWGVAIILLTLIIKLLFFKLSATAYRSMARMRKVAPEMTRIREQYKNDRQKQSQELMKLYQKEKINPLGGCLPILVQMPVFIALYYVLLESVELRQAPFFGWIQDLSVMDPYFILPLLMGASMWLQMQLNPTPPDPTQAQVMKWMPVIFTFFFLWFPAGLVLYWLTNNLLSIAQQWVITRKIEREGG